MVPRLTYDGAYTNEAPFDIIVSGHGDAHRLIRGIARRLCEVVLNLVRNVLDGKKIRHASPSQNQLEGRQYCANMVSYFSIRNWSRVMNCDQGHERRPIGVICAPCRKQPSQWHTPICLLLFGSGTIVELCAEVVLTVWRCTHDGL